MAELLKFAVFHRLAAFSEAAVCVAVRRVTVADRWLSDDI